MERKMFKFELKSVNEMDGTFEGVLSAFRKTPDKQKDIARPGCFKKTISENPTIPTLFMHDVMSPVGKMELAETDKGLSIKGQLIKGIQKAEECLLLMKVGVIKNLSMGYDVLQREFKDGVRYMTEVKVYEGSLVIGDFASDDEAVITSVKTKRDGKASTFEDNLNWNNMRSTGFRMLDTLYQTIDNIIYDSEETDKTAAMDAAITSFHDAYIAWIQEAVDMGVIKVDKSQFETKAQAVKDAFHALLKSTEVKQEPTPVTPAAKEDQEAAQLDEFLGGLKYESEIKEAERKLDSFIAQIT